MTTLDIHTLTVQQRLDLIGEIWDSLEAEAVPLSPAHAEEIDRRLATLDQDIKTGIDAADVLAEMRRRNPHAW
jgi:putative addiction module component (TIGR02574 family)